MARGCVAIGISNCGFAAGKREFLVGGSVNRFFGCATAVALTDYHGSHSDDAGQLAASGDPGSACAGGACWRWRWRAAFSGRLGGGAEVGVERSRCQFALVRGGGHSVLQAGAGLVVPIGEDWSVNDPKRRSRFCFGGRF